MQPRPRTIGLTLTRGLTSRVRRWAAWAPACPDAAAWEAWATAPDPIGTEGHPEARFLPPLLRRRCTPLTRMMLTAAFNCCDEQERAEVRTVFASRHGSINDSIGLLEALVRGERISPAKFSHTIHNAQAGLFSIAATNRQASSSLSARADTFGSAYLEALTHLEREPARPVLLVIGDVPLDATFAPLVHEAVATYALALLLTTDGEGDALSFGIGEADTSVDAGAALPRWPDAMEFLRWLLAKESALTLRGGRCAWSWTRTANGAH